MAEQPQQKRVMGVFAPPPKLTGAGYKAIARYVVAPVLGVLLALDVAGFLIAKYVFNTCYGVLCLL